MRRRRLVAALLLTASAAVPLAGCAAGSEPAAAGSGYVSGDGTVSAFAPGERGSGIEFEGTTDRDTTVASADLRGDVVVVNFWYAACPPCRLEAPWLRDLSVEYADDGVEFLGVNVRDDAPTAQAFARTFSIEYPSILDRDGSVVIAFAGEVSPAAVPTTLVLDREGRIAARIVGVIDRDILAGLIDDVIAEVDE